jgi:hypothetical protein
MGSSQNLFQNVRWVQPGSPLGTFQLAARLRSLRRSVAAVCRRGCAEITGTRARWQASLMRELNALLLKGAPFLPGKTSGSHEVDFPTPSQPHAFDAFQESEPSSK